MADADPRMVFLAENTKIAEAVVALLASAGIAAEAVVPPPQAMVEPLPGVTAMASGSSIEVIVTDPAKIAEAKGLIDSAVAAGVVHAIRQKRASRSGTVTAVCEECGQSSEWQAVAMGTTETCPHCYNYMDIPDPDDENEWAGVDFGTPEGEDEVEK